MNKYAFVTVLLIFIFSNSYAQKTLSDYSYIVIPEQYDFLSEKDKYQINSLTKFLFNKHGFHAYIADEVPENLVTCDGLKADVVRKNGIIYTKLQIVINDCHGKEVYRSAFGKSKIKEFSKVFNDALRKSFASIIALNVNQKDISNSNISNVSEVKNETISTEIVKENVIEGASIQKVKENNVKSEKTIFPTRQYSTYKSTNEIFLLRKTEQGYSLYRDVAFNPYEANKNNGLILLGEVLVSKSKVFYLGLKEKLVDAQFDDSLNLIIDKPSGKVTYKFKYFEELSGSFSLPEGYYPRNVLVKLFP
ncbi:MAG: hypothetical protein KUG68_10990, partial [Flavobacteriaceae bacterium]|nr:hypothetical protein [Flavobacteriaceae bacterium]